MIDIINTLVIENFFLVIIGLIILLLVLRVVLKERKISLLAREAMSFREILEFSPDAFFVWLKDSKGNVYPMASRKLSIILRLENGRSTGFEEVLAKIDENNDLIKSLHLLQKDGSRFISEIKLKNKDRYFLCEGHKIVTFTGEELATIIWFKDISDRFISSQKGHESTAKLESEKKYYENILDSLPFPLWVRNDGELVSDCNNSYALAVEASSKNEVKQNHIELAQGGDVQEIRALSILAKKEQQTHQGIFSIILNSQLKHIEISESNMNSSQTVGWAREISLDEHEFIKISSQQDMYQKILSNYPLGFLVMDDKQHIQNYNEAFLKIWSVTDEFMSSCSSLSDLLRELKQLRKLPENRDFAVYKDQLIKFYQDVDEASSEVLYLPDGVTIKRQIIPLENGGTITYFEDVSYQLALERNFYSLSENYKIALDNISDAIVIFGDNGRLKLMNNAFLKLWNFDESSVENRLLSEILELKKPFFDNKYNWVDVKSEMLSHITSGNTQVITMERNDNRKIDCTSIRLVDGSIMIIYKY